MQNTTTDEDFDALRVGLIVDGKVVEETIFRRPTEVMLGRGPRRGDLSFPVDDLPDAFQLFDWWGDHWRVRMPAGSAGKLRESGGVAEVAGPDHGEAPAPWRSLRDVDRGRVQIGEATVIFQLVDPPPNRERAELPGELRWGWFREMDGGLPLAIAAAALLQVGFVAWTLVNEWPQRKLLDRAVVDTYAVDQQTPQTKTNLPDPRDGTPTATSPEEASKPDAQRPSPFEESRRAKAEPVEPRQETSAPASDQEDAPPPSTPTDTTARQVSESSSGTVLEALGGDSESGGVMAELDDDTPMDEFDRAIADSQSAGPDVPGADGSPQPGGYVDDEATGETATIGGIDPMNGGRPGGVDTGQKERTDVECEGDCGDVQVLQYPADPDPSSSYGPRLSQFIKRHSAQLQGCYERELKRDRTLAGKIVTEFTIATNGRLKTFSARTDTVGAGVADCINGLLNRWSLPTPDTAQAEVRKTFVFSPAQ